MGDIPNRPNVTGFSKQIEQDSSSSSSDSVVLSPVFRSDTCKNQHASPLLQNPDSSHKPKRSGKGEGHQTLCIKAASLRLVVERQQGWVRVRLSW